MIYDNFQLQIVSFAAYVLKLEQKTGSDWVNGPPSHSIRNKKEILRAKYSYLQLNPHGYQAERKRTSGINDH